jgi:predicted nucleic acid-binding protein
LTACVIDASVTAAWCFQDEASAPTQAIFEAVREHGALVPALWQLEVANALLQAERRRRITVSDMMLRLELISALPISIDAESGGRAWRETLHLARAERLTTYDASYLELAIRRALPLATLDQALMDAARRIGLKVMP